MKGNHSKETGGLWLSVSFHLCLFLAAMALSCHPARQIEKQNIAIDELKAKWIGDWVLSHPCPLLPEINLDSLCQAIHGANGGDFSFGLADTIRTDSVGRVV